MSENREQPRIEILNTFKSFLVAFPFSFSFFAPRRAARAPVGAMLKALYSPIYFTKPAAEPVDVLGKRLAQYGPVRVGNGDAEWMSSLDGSEALVADISGSDTTVGAEVAYALHKCRIPVLCLRRRGTSAVRAIDTNAHPLLTCHEYADDSSAASAIDDFLTPPTSPGRIFVVEGGDGAGKQTQTALLRDRLTAMGYPVSTIDFPHDAAMHGMTLPAMPAAHGAPQTLRAAPSHRRVCVT